jgi:phage baseplate assembly protein W
VTVEQPISPALADAHRAAVDDANRWRGYCVDKFARAEARMRQAIEAMLVHPDGAGLKRPSMFGQHVAELSKAVAEEGPFAKSGSKVRDALVRCESGFALRNVVTHAVGTIWVDGQRRWLWHYHFQPTGKGKPIESGSLTQDDAELVRRNLAASVRRLDDHLQIFIKGLNPVTK